MQVQMCLENFAGVGNQNQIMALQMLSEITTGGGMKSVRFVHKLRTNHIAGTGEWKT